MQKDIDAIAVYFYADTKCTNCKRTNNSSHYTEGNLAHITICLTDNLSKQCEQEGINETIDS